ncbi:SHOCT domain-containing protein [Streptomyces apricus]|uniref:SHOCT domain-containing protein n=1 Tax=Streptomyces apricus TaxID=1828112 RepID=A0A5B0A2W9_9ACTN|nr:SHOCT domain-containing protein [Streptomyces apricus]KAA0923651.1 SHOCT domain-containing protein [Streptomyces apricus]
MYLAYDYPLMSVFWSMLIFFLWIMWFVLLFRIVVDIFRDDDMSGWGKAGWLVFVVFLPFLGVFVYVIARGKNMGHREVAQARAQQQAFDSYVRETARSADRPSSVDELARLSEIRARGDITEEEFHRAKELVLSGSGAGTSGRAGAGASAAGH